MTFSHILFVMEVFGIKTLLQRNFCRMVILEKFQEISYMNSELIVK